MFNFKQEVIDDEMIYSRIINDITFAYNFNTHSCVSLLNTTSKNQEFFNSLGLPSTLVNSIDIEMYNNNEDFIADIIQEIEK